MCHSIHVAVNTWLNCSFFTLIVSTDVFSLSCFALCVFYVFVFCIQHYYAAILNKLVCVCVYACLASGVIASSWRLCLLDGTFVPHTLCVQPISESWIR